MGQISVITGPERRRRWSAAERHEIVAEAFAPGACVAQVARSRAISTSLIYTWRHKLREEMVECGFAPAVADVEPACVTREPCEAIIVELPGGSRVRVGASAPPALAAAVLRALR